MPTVLLAVIHNGELSTAPARLVMDELMEDEIAQRVIEITAQPPLSETVDRAALKQWRRTQWELERQWREYLGLGSMGRNAVGLVGHALFAGRAAMSATYAARVWRARQIESFVSAKHVGAWRAFADGQEDLLIVIESDATMRSNTAIALDSIMSGVTGTPYYANLASGLDRDEIGIDHLVSERTEIAVQFGKPVTNTSCAYLVNRSFVDALLAFLDRKPYALMLGVDWIFNAFFLDADQRGPAIACVHAEPPALGHGSLTGVTRSWHPDR